MAGKLQRVIGAGVSSDARLALKPRACPLRVADVACLQGSFLRYFNFFPSYINIMNRQTRRAGGEFTFHVLHHAWQRF